MLFQISFLRPKNVFHLYYKDIIIIDPIEMDEKNGFAQRNCTAYTCTLCPHMISIKTATIEDCMMIRENIHIIRSAT